MIAWHSRQLNSSDDFKTPWAGPRALVGDTGCGDPDDLAGCSFGASARARCGSTMNVLAFDTATELMSIALAVDGTVFSHEATGGALASARLIPSIMALLNQADVRLGDLDAIAFGRGPGAFTGLRTACSVAQGLAYGAGKPVLPIDTLLIVAEAARAGSAEFRVWVTLDARMNEIYAAQYHFTAHAWRVLNAPMLTSAVALNHCWKNDAPSVIAGNALTVFGDQLQSHGATLLPLAAPHGFAMLPLAETLWGRGETVDAALALPLYLRDKVAQTTVERDAVRAAKEAAGAPG